jgi:predicted nucleotidyltransferase
MEIARILNNEPKWYSEGLQMYLKEGYSYPAARAAALPEYSDILYNPNNILGIEYCKAILTQGTRMKPFPIHREGSYHAELPDPENPSATALRNLLIQAENWQNYVPNTAIGCFENAPIHTLQHGQQAILYRLRTMTDSEFEALPYGNEGLWRKLMHASRKFATLDAIVNNVKSKRYTRTRLDRMILCAFLGITQEMMQTPAPYVRVLALNDKGREILKTLRQSGCYPNIGEHRAEDYQLLENRCTDLFGLFAETPEVPGAESQYRVYCQKNGEV